MTKTIIGTITNNVSNTRSAPAAAAEEEEEGTINLLFVPEMMILVLYKYDTNLVILQFTICLKTNQTKNR